MTRMYAEAKTWNPFKGCEFDCIYCEPSFKRICRLYNKCKLCKEYIPHTHPERLDKVPKAKIIFVAGNGDISFCSPEFVEKIIDVIVEHPQNSQHPDRTFYLQSKNPACFRQYIPLLPSNVILVTTLETNRDEGYRKISKAPKPMKRFRDFLNLKWERKVITIEPIMDFDHWFFDMITYVNPEYVWIGYNSKPKDVQLPEPPLEKTKYLIDKLRAFGIEVRGKELRGIKND